MERWKKVAIASSLPASEERELHDISLAAGLPGLAGLRNPQPIIDDASTVRVLSKDLEDRLSDARTYGDAALTHGHFTSVL